jgi:hypothetical protein
MLTNPGRFPLGAGRPQRPDWPLLGQPAGHGHPDCLASTGNTAAYRLDQDGTLSLILKSGAVTDLGTIAEIGGLWFGVGLNTKGQVALPVRMAGETRYQVILLTPVEP